MKNTRKPAVTVDEVTLFRDSVSDATPLLPTKRVEHALPLPPPIPARRPRDDRQTPKDKLKDDASIASGVELSYVRNGISMDTLRKLRRGHWVTEEELDLHGMTVPEARGFLVEFLDLCVRRGLRCIRVIHGKGLRSENREPVLKRNVALWLMQRDEILAFCQARSTDGGSGAVAVLLKGETRKAVR